MPTIDNNARIKGSHNLLKVAVVVLAFFSTSFSLASTIPVRAPGKSLPAGPLSVIVKALESRILYPQHIASMVFSFAHTLPSSFTIAGSSSRRALQSIPTDLSSGITLTDSLPQITFANTVLSSPLALLPSVNLPIRISQLSHSLALKIPQLVLGSSSGTGRVLGAATTADSSSVEKSTLPILDRISLALYCALSPQTSALDALRCNYDAQAQGIVKSLSSSNAATSSVKNAADADTSSSASVTTTAIVATSTPPAPVSVSSGEPTPIYITRYITQYIEGAPGRDGRDGKDGNDATVSANINNVSVPSGFSGYFAPSPSYSTPVGFSTIGYLKDATIENSIFTGGTATNLSLASPSLQGAVFNGSSVFTGSATINGAFNVLGTTTLATTTLSVLNATTATLANLTTTNATNTNFFTQNLSVGNASVQGNQFITGAFNVSGTSTLGANVFLNGNVVIGTSSNEMLTVNALVNSNIVPAQNKIYDLGSSSFFWRNLFADNITVNSISAASSTIAGTNSNTFSINADNVSTDTESMSLIFTRGVVTPNALLRWNSTLKRFESNMSLHIQNETPSVGTTTLVVQGGAGQGSTNLFELATSAGTTTTVFNALGSLGIGTTTPSSLLQVAGTTTLGIGNSIQGVLSLLNSSNLFSTSLRASSTQAANLMFTLPGTLGSSGQVLTADGTGGLYFTTAGGASLSGGQTGFIPRWLSATTLGTSTLLDTGTVAGINATSSSFTFNIQASPAFNPFNVASSSGVTLFNVLANGNVGIGTNAPGGLLNSRKDTPGSVQDIIENRDTAGIAMFKARTGTSAAQYGALAFNSSATSNTDLTTVPSAASLFTAGTGGLNIISADGSAPMIFAVGGAAFTNEKVRITTAGNVGIGTTTPQEKLDVAGNINISAGSAYKYNGQSFFTASTSLNNYFIGGFSGNSAATGSDNVGIGFLSLGALTSGSSNTAFGSQSLTSVTSGGSNSAFGSNALQFLTTGNDNTAVGPASMQFTTTGAFNTAVGGGTLFSNTTGTDNLAVGAGALGGNTTGTSNVALGSNAGFGSGQFINNNSVIDTQMVFLGVNASRDAAIPTSTGLTNGIAIGYDSRVFASNQVVLGNDSITSTLLRGNVGIGTTTPLASLFVQGVGGANPFTVASSTGKNLFQILSTGVAILGSDGGTPTATTFRGAQASGTNVAGGNLTFDASNGTGLGGSGAFIFRTALPGANSLALDATSTATSSDVNGLGGTFFWSHTVTSASASRIILVSVYQADTGTSTDVTSVSYGGLGLTKIGGNSTPSGVANISYWYLLDPPTGTNSVSVTYLDNSGTSSTIAASAMSFVGVNPANPFGPMASSLVTATTTSIAVSSTAGDLVISTDLRQTNATLTPGGGATKIFAVVASSSGSNIGSFAGSTLLATTTSTVMSWTAGTSGLQVVGGIALHPDTVSSTQSNTLTERVRITTGGRFAALQVNGDIRIGATSTQTGCVQGFNGSVLAGTCSSDERLKTDITDFSPVLAKFTNLRIINYKWNATAGTLYGDDTSASQIGYLAQNVESLFPELVSVNQEGFRQVNYSAMSLYTAEGLKELAIQTKTENQSISMFPADEAVDYGTIVAFSTSTHPYTDMTSSSTYSMVGIRKALSGDEAVGIVTTQAASSSVPVSAVPVAFSGKVKVHLAADSGNVSAGEYLTVSVTMPGAATKMTSAGRSIGVALSSGVAGSDVLMFVGLGYQNVNTSSRYATTTGMLTTGNVDLNANGVAIFNIKSLASANGSWSIDENGRIVAKVLCLEDVCIDKAQLTNILNSTGQSGIVAGTSTQANQSSPVDTSTTTASTSTDSSTISSDTLAPVDIASPSSDASPPTDTANPAPAEQVPPEGTAPAPEADSATTP